MSEVNGESWMACLVREWQEQTERREKRYGRRMIALLVSVLLALVLYAAHVRMVRDCGGQPAIECIVNFLNSDPWARRIGVYYFRAAPGMRAP